jgi:hypothetical protein
MYKRSSRLAVIKGSQVQVSFSVVLTLLFRTVDYNILHRYRNMLTEEGFVCTAAVAGEIVANPLSVDRASK